MKFLELLEYLTHNLQVPLFAQPLLLHHAAEVGIPLFRLRPLLVGQFKAAQVFGSHPVGIQAVCPEQVLHLPHVEQVFGAVRLSELVSYRHGVY